VPNLFYGIVPGPFGKRPGRVTAGETISYQEQTMNKEDLDKLAELDEKIIELRGYL